MRNITKITEKYISQIKKRGGIYMLNGTLSENLIVTIWDKIFSDYHYLGGTLEELVEHIGQPLRNEFEITIPKYYEERGIYGIGYKTKGNVRYTGTNDLHYINVKDFNKFVKETIAI